MSTPSDIERTAPMGVKFHADEIAWLERLIANDESTPALRLRLLIRRWRERTEPAA